MVPFGAGCAAVLPGACQTEVVGALAADMVVAEMVIESLWILEGAGARLPLTDDRVGLCCRRGWGAIWGVASGSGSGGGGGGGGRVG
jgi:hypothetical protein